MLFFSLEMSGDALRACHRDEGGIDSTMLRTGAISTPALVSITKSCARIVEFPLWIEDEVGLTIGEDIRSRARRWKLNDAKDFAKQPLIIVDYIGPAAEQSQPAHPRARGRRD